jgi:hypothetical protein
MEPAFPRREGFSTAPEEGDELAIKWVGHGRSLSSEPLYGVATTGHRGPSYEDGLAVADDKKPR